MVVLDCLFSSRSANGASICTSAAFDASVSVNDIDAIAFGDSLNRAFTCASAASDASVGNYVCHESASFVSNLISL